MNITRSLYVLAGGVLLGYALLIIGAWLTVLIEPGTAYDMAYVPYWQYLPHRSSGPRGDPNAGPLFLFYQFGVWYPILSIAVGLFVGRHSDSWAWLLTPLCLAPVLSLQALDWSWRGESDARLIALSYMIYFGGYSVLGMIAAYGMSRRRLGKSVPSSAPPEFGTHGIQADTGMSDKLQFVFDFPHLHFATSATN